tara:strand:+ start:100 stop:264 length:165 start_codon:yes stop_codon:yes gene_type:complete
MAKQYECYVAEYYEDDDLIEQYFALHIEALTFKQQKEMHFGISVKIRRETRMSL